MTSQSKGTKKVWQIADSITAQYKYFLSMTDEELEDWLILFPKNKRTRAQRIALVAVKRAEDNIHYLREIANRTEGKSPQAIDLTTKGESLNTFTNEQKSRIASRIVRGTPNNTTSTGKSN